VLLYILFKEKKKMVYTTAALVQGELRATNTFGTDTNPTLSTVNTWIEQVTDRINDKAHYSFETTAYTDYFDYNSSDLFLRHSPVLSITSLKYNSAADGETKVWVTKTEDTDFITYDKEGRIKFIPSKFTPNVGSKNIEVIYSAGYSSVPSRVEELATKMVAQRVIESLLSNNVNERNAGGSISVGSINIVEPGDYGVGTFKQLNSDIVSLMNEVTHNDFMVYRYG